MYSQLRNGRVFLYERFQIPKNHEIRMDEGVDEVKLRNKWIFKREQQHNYVKL